MASRSKSRFRKISDRLRAGTAAQAHAGHLLDDEPQRLRFSAAIPGLGGDSLFKIAVEAHTEPDAFGGERIRMRAHLQANLASVVKPALSALIQKAADRAQAYQAALPAPPVRGGELAGHGGAAMRQVTSLSNAFAPLRARAGGWLAERVQTLAPALSNSLQPLLENDLQTWVELHASTAPLADGAKSLLPNAKGLAKLGIVPVDGPTATPLQAWSGQVGSEAAQVALLRLDESNLPEQLKEALGGKPFSLAAAVVSVATRR